MRESTIEKYFVKQVEAVGGVAYKFKSPTQRGVADRIVCLPDGSTWFVELKTKGGELSMLQQIHARNLRKLNQNYACLWSIDDVDRWVFCLGL